MNDLEKGIGENNAKFVDLYTRLEEKTAQVQKLTEKVETLSRYIGFVEEIVKTEDNVKMLRKAFKALRNKKYSELLVPYGASISN